MEERRIERVQLELPARVGSGAPEQVADREAIEAAEFSRALQAFSGERGDTPTETTLRDLIAEFVAPLVKDPALLSADRSITILELLLTTILPQLDDDEEFRQLAIAVIGDEIKQRRRLRARRRGETAA
jgi:hypothetical protein